jgi:hypothetical protein
MLTALRRALSACPPVGQESTTGAQVCFSMANVRLDHGLIAQQTLHVSGALGARQLSEGGKGSAASPVITSPAHAFEAQCIHEVEEVGNHRLLRHLRRRRMEEVGSAHTRARLYRGHRHIV